MTLLSPLAELEKIQISGEIADFFARFPGTDANTAELEAIVGAEEVAKWLLLERRPAVGMDVYPIRRPDDDGIIDVKGNLEFLDAMNEVTTHQTYPATRWRIVELVQQCVQAVPSAGICAVNTRPPSNMSTISFRPIQQL